MLKQFLPQLQTTFLKALNDSSRQVRLKAAHALGHLIVIHPKADPLFSELHSGVKSSDDSSIRCAAIFFLHHRKSHRKKLPVLWILISKAFFIF